MDLVFLSTHMVAWIGHAPPELSASGMSLRIAFDLRLRYPVLQRSIISCYII
jgi:hypothetical protein